MNLRTGIPFGEDARQPNGIRRLDLVTGVDTAFSSDICEYVDDWTHDNRFVICRGKGALSVPVSGSGVPTRLRDNNNVDQWHVSADGRWIAYNSNETGEWEVYVAPFPQLAPARQVSVAGGVQPAVAARWP